MNRTIFWRVFWKEYRLQRALWIAMALLTALLLLVFHEFFSQRDRPLFLFWAASGLPAFYLLGCGALLFAGEHEAGTYEFQRGLPVDDPPATPHGILDKYRIQTCWTYGCNPYTSYQSPKSEYDIWSSGWPFPIP